MKKTLFLKVSLFVGINGFHLKGSYKGLLLSTMGLDGNNGLFFVAYVCYCRG